MEPLITYERALAALAEAVETYTANHTPTAYDALEAALGHAKFVLRPKGVEE